MVRVSEANLSTAMKFVFDHWIVPAARRLGEDPDALNFSPKSQKDKDYFRDNPTTGIIYLEKHPNAKEAWLLVKFEHKRPTYGQSTVPQDRKTIKTLDDFTEFFGVTPTQNFFDDTVIQVSWNKQTVPNHNPKRDFDETTPNFYRYGNHLNVSLDKAVQGMYRINDIIDKTGSVGNLFKIPYSLTNFK